MSDPITHHRWSRTEESADFFIDEDALRGRFYLLMAGGAILLAVLATGLWRLQRSALAPPVFVGIAHGLIFSGRPESLASVRDDDFDRQLADTVEVLFGRTEKGLPPEIADFCAPEVVSAVGQAYKEAAAKYPAGYVQTLALLESRTVMARPGFRRMYYRGLLSSRSVSAGQASPIYLDCTFVIGGATPFNASGWRLTHLDALGRDDYYRAEHENAVRQKIESSHDAMNAIRPQIGVKAPNWWSGLPPTRWFVVRVEQRVRGNALHLFGIISCVFLWPAGLRSASAASASELLPGVPTEVFVAPGRATTILFQTDQKVAAISLASPVVTYKYDRSLNQLEITPAVRSPGVETNLNLRIGPDVYILVVTVVNDVRAQFFRRFELQGDPGRDEEAGLAQARPMKPEEVDIVGAAKAMERAEADPVFGRAHPALRIEALGQGYPWNGCLISLAAVGQFLDQDLLVFRVQWVNRTNDALYLDATQYGLFAGGHKIPVISRYKMGGGPVVYPGQLETVYLAVQGYRLSRNNDWQLSLPPDAAAVTRLLSR